MSRKLAATMSALLALAPLLADPPPAPSGVASQPTEGKSLGGVPDAGLLINFQNSDVDGVLKFFSEITGDTYIRSEAVQRFVTVAAPGHVTREEALQILRTALALRGIVLVPGPGRIVRVLTEAEAVPTDLTVSTQAVAGMVTRILPLKFLAVQDIRAELTPLLSRGGNLIADPRSNAFVVTDDAAVIRRLADVLAALDVRSPQVLIEALIVEVSLTAETKLGLEWSQAGAFHSKGHAFPENASAGFDLPSFVTEGLRYSVMRDDGRLAGLLQMLATDQNVNILSTPHIVAVNNQTALIRVGEEVPVLTQTRNIQGGETIRSFDFKQVAVELEVTPRVSPDRDVYLKVHPQVKKILGFNAELDAPILATREAQTAVQVQDGDTVVIGGLMKDDRSSDRSKIPLLGDIPLIGWLFRKTDNTREKTELLVFITPHVMTTPEESRSVTIRKESESGSANLPHRLPARDALLEGRRLYSQKKFAEAAVQFKSAEESSPEQKIRAKARRWREKAEDRIAD